MVFWFGRYGVLGIFERVKMVNVMKKSIYEVITERFIEMLENGVVPWRKPWSGGGFPVNAQTGRAYSGSNVFLLSCAPYASNKWLTYKQSLALGGNVRRGERGFPVVYWNFLEKADGNGDVKKLPLLRYYTVFNVEQIAGCEQCDGLLVSGAETFDNAMLPEPEAFIAGLNGHVPEIKHIENRAFYSPVLDYINVPGMEYFESSEAYYSTLFHELLHSTGHNTRLNRDGVGRGDISFGSGIYSNEELVAEIGASFCCNACGILPAVVDNSASYIANWLKRLRGDARLLLTASGHAEKAFKYLTGSAGE